MVTDSTACVPPEEVGRYGIGVVPVPLVFNGRTYRDGIDITPAEFYTMLRRTKQIPTTSASSPGPYLEAFTKAAAGAESILCLTEPVKFSAMYESAGAAARTARETPGGPRIEIVECTTAAAGLGLTALAAAQAAAGGGTLEEVKSTAVRVMDRVRLYAALDTLAYLARGGRVPQAAALVNSVLNIKPVFTLNHQGAKTLSLTRTIGSAAGRMLKYMDKDKGRRLRAAVMHADMPAEAAELKASIQARFDCPYILMTEFTPVMGVHTGPGLLGVAYYPEDQPGPPA